MPVIKGFLEPLDFVLADPPRRGRRPTNRQVKSRKCFSPTHEINGELLQKSVDSQSAQPNLV